MNSYIHTFRSFLIISLGASFLIFQSCNNSKENSSEQKELKQIHKQLPKKETKADKFGSLEKTIQLGFINLENPLPQLEFEPITKQEYSEYNKLSKNNINSDNSYIQPLSDTSFVIQTAKAKLVHFKETKFVNDKNGHTKPDRKPWTHYIGYIKPLKLYVIESRSVSEDIGFGSSILIDSVSNVEYEILSFSDGANKPPVFSPNNKYAASYSNIEDGSAAIGILKIVESGKDSKFREFAVFESSELSDTDNSEDIQSEDKPNWEIEDLVWINDNSFAIKVKQKTLVESGKWKEKHTYFKTSLPK